MILRLEDCIKILEETPDENLSRAVYHENRVKLHTEPTLASPDNPAYGEFISKVKKRIPDDAYDRFISLIEFPFCTVDYSEGVFSGFNKVFESQDRYINVSFNNPDYDNDYKSYVSKIDRWFKENAVNTLKTKFNSYVVVDLPSEQEKGRPEPYFYILPVGNVKNVRVNRKNKVEWIAFDTGDKKGDKKVYAVFDSAYYRLFIEDGKKFKPLLDEELSPVEVPHNLGWCPVAPFWSDVLDPTVTMLNKKSPATNSIGRLDTLAFKMISKEYSDLYNMYSIIWSYPEEEDEERLHEEFGVEGDECGDLEGPIVKNKSNSNKILTNPARHVIKPLPDADMGDIGDPMGFIEPNVENLRFILEDLELRKEDIQYSIAGKPNEPKNDQAKNQKQISAGFEGQYTVLLSIAHNMALIEEWILKTCAALRYGKDSLKDASVSNGKNYFLHTHMEVMEEMGVAKQNNLPEYLIDQQEKQFINTKYKSNPEQQERMHLIRLLTPYRQMSLPQFMANISYLDPEKVKLRLEFFDVLSRFETKFAPIESFEKYKGGGELMEMDKRIEKIKQEFKVILAEYQTNTQPEVQEEENQ